MAQSFATSQGNLIIPGAYASVSVLTQPSGLATSGIVMLVGEADQGPDYTLESDLTLNVFGPDQAGAVLAKYKSGPLVDAFLSGAAPSSDPEIQNSPAGFILVKTNASIKASGNLTKWGGGNYSVPLADKSFGAKGNLIFFTTAAATNEVVPSATFAWIPNTGTVSVDFRVNGAAAQAFNALAANTTPAGFVTALAGLTGGTVSGGASRSVITAVAGTLAVAVVSGNTATFTISTAWANTPLVGDTLFISSTSVVKGGANQNAGGWMVTAATSTVITAVKLADTSSGSLTTITAPTGVGAVAIASTTNDLQAFAPVTVAMSAANPVDGVGKSIEMAETQNGGATDFFGKYIYTISGTTPVYSAACSKSLPATAAWVASTSYALGNIVVNNGLFYRCVGAGISAALGATGPTGTALTTTVTDGTVTWAFYGQPGTISSATEYSVQLSVGRQFDGTNESITAGGAVALKIGYRGTTATLTITPTALSTAVVGGPGANLSLLLSQFVTINDIAAFINAQPGYNASAGTTLQGQQLVTALDEVTALPIATTNNAPTGRVKRDASDFFVKVGVNSQTVQLGTSATGTVPAIGIPAPNGVAVYLTGGSRGGSTNANFTGGIDALQKVRGNFLIPLISQDATADIPLGLTDATSTYTVDSINAYAKSHVILMSTLKRRRNRQAFLSKRDSFVNAQLAAGNIANFRCSMHFQDIKTVNSAGNLIQQQPWMGAVIAASMQAAGFYKAIVNKLANISGALQAASDFSDQDSSALETALVAGLCPIEKAESGGFKWVSDQTTYGVDNNFVFNSIQAVYAADIVALTCAKRMQDKFKGQSLADVSAAIATSFMQGVLNDFLRLKLLAPSSDAPTGYKNLKIQITGPAMVVSVEVKLATAIYFIPISFLVSQVTQTSVPITK
jgi:hypothetical protein